MLIAEAMSSDPTVGMTTMVLQAGAFGLLCYIVMYLYPKAARDAREERTSRDKAFSDIFTLTQDRFEGRNTAVVRSIESQTDVLRRELQSQSQLMAQTLAQACKASHP